MSELQLTVVTPDGTYGPIRCESVRLSVSDDLNGRGGGSCGIRPGHVASLMSLDKGPLTALLDGTVVLSAKCGGGFASVSDNKVTVVTDEYSEN